MKLLSSVLNLDGKILVFIQQHRQKFLNHFFIFFIDKYFICIYQRINVPKNPCESIIGPNKCLSYKEGFLILIVTSEYEIINRKRCLNLSLTIYKKKNGMINKIK